MCSVSQERSGAADNAQVAQPGAEVHDARGLGRHGPERGVHLGDSFRSDGGASRNVCAPFGGERDREFRHEKRTLALPQTPLNIFTYTTTYLKNP